ncbi:LLM class flavin-dependent oxidoreductase [Pseudomonas sp. LRF_L74]|uniref:LLM class flavin-dependent oxidoreductase n=1 Tax=Pseudomonas sp. LRF_L74 TaxID=3369422 RepID=UPI003F5DB86D
MTHAKTRQLRLAAMLPAHAAKNGAWRLPEAQADIARRFEPFVEACRTLERGRFDALFLPDGLSVGDDPVALAGSGRVMRWDPLTLLPALAPLTRHLGLVATASTSYNEPYALARRLASLDWLSGGRAGWNLVTSTSGGENFNLDQHLEHDLRYQRAEEFVEVIKSLWDSWEDEAPLLDKDAGVLFDVARMHRLEHRGRYFAVKGPLNAPRPPQGHPVVFQSGSSEVGRELGAASADVIFTASQSLADAQAFYADMARRLEAHGRRQDELLIMPGVSVQVGRTLQEAQECHERAQTYVERNNALSVASGRIGFDLAALPFDAPIQLPETVPLTNANQSRQQLLLNLVREERLSVRQLLERMSSGGHRVLIGTPQSIADDFQHWLESRACDGFNLIFPLFPGDVERFVELVVPELQHRGLLRTEYRGATLRDNLGLARPGNRFVRQAQQ